MHKTQFTVYARTEEKIESLNEIKMSPKTETGHTELTKRMRLYKETRAVVKLTVESKENTKYFKN